MFKFNEKAKSSVIYYKVTQRFVILSNCLLYSTESNVVTECAMVIVSVCSIRAVSFNFIKIFD